jgi:signal transduction histidine kinase/ligand-binding sensor domain-containing protein
MAARLLVVLLISSFIAPLSHSQEYIFNRLSIQDGLLSNNILCVWQDKTGYLWIGTENGLQRYDGYTFRTVLQKRVDQILSDHKQRVWLRSGKILGTFDTASFHFSPVATDNNITVNDANAIVLQADKSQRIFAITIGKNCQYYDERSNRFTSKANPFIIPDTLRIINIVDDTARQRTWITTFNGLGYWDKRTRKYYSSTNNEQHDPLLSNKKLDGLVSRFFIDHAQRYWIQSWIGSNMHFFCYDSKKAAFTKDTAGLADAGNGFYFDVFAFDELNDTSIFVYGRHCLRIRDNGAFRELKGPIQDPYSIRFNTVNHILQDNERVLWFATDDGLYNTSGTINRNFHVVLAPERSNAAINALYQDVNNRIWLGTWGGGMLVIDEQQGRLNIGKSLQQQSDGFSKLIWTISESKRSNKLWVGCQQGRLMIYDLKTGETKLHVPAAFEPSTIRKILADDTGAFWIGLNNGKLFKCDHPERPINDNSFRLVHDFTGPVVRLRFDDEKRLWIAVAGKGLYALAPGKETILQSLDRTNTSTSIIGSVRDLLQVNDSLFLLAADELGFYNTRTGSIRTISSYNNLPVGVSYALEKDKNGDCWIGTSTGIFKYNPKTGSITKYSQRDGMLTVHNNSYIPENSMVMRDGRLAFGGNQHFVAFDAAQYRTKATTPSVSITGFQLNNNYLRFDSLQKLSLIRLPYTGNSFTIEFAVLSFLQHEKLTYEYKLEGSNEEWIEVKHPLPVKYNLLPHGHYTFLVRARNSDGVYSAVTTKLPIYIAPPFWRATWFYIAVGLLVIAFLYYLHRLRLERLLHVEKVRSRLARDLHDDMGSTLSTINILSNIALQQTPFDEKSSKEYMSTINSSTTQMMESMDDIVWSINPVNDSLVKVLARMKEVAGNVLEPSNIDYRFEADPAVKELNFSMEWRREIFLIFKEALNNIVKYASAGNVYVSLKKSGRSFVLMVEDNGAGFDMGARTSATRGNGLKNMKKRAESLGGSLEVQSAPGQGTRLTISVPIA